MELKITPWMEQEPPTEEYLQNQLVAQDLRVYHWSRPPEDFFAGHTHGYHKVLYVVKGSIKFDFPTRHETVTLNLGDRLDLPAGVRHSAIVGEQGVTCLEAHVY